MVVKSFCLLCAPQKPTWPLFRCISLGYWHSWPAARYSEPWRLINKSARGHGNRRTSANEIFKVFNLEACQPWKCPYNIRHVSVPAQLARWWVTVLCRGLTTDGFPLGVNVIGNVYISGETEVGPLCCITDSANNSLYNPGNSLQLSTSVSPIVRWGWWDRPSQEWLGTLIR